MEFIDPNTIKSIKQLEDEFKKVFLIVDEHVIKMLMAAVIANRMNTDPVWLFLVAGPSGGKTELINAVEGLPFVYEIDTLTTNSFASGQKRAGKETSLLLKLDGGEGIFTFKDFTAILDMNPVARTEIMGQLRNIYDRKFVKRTGTGEDIEWNGKVGLIAAVTSIIHERQSEFSSMGERFIQYAIKQPDRRAVQKRKFENMNGMDAKREHLQNCVTAYITYVLAKMMETPISISDTLLEELYDIADFSTSARSSVEKSQRTGLVTFIPDKEMPTRVTTQLLGIAKALIAINKADPTLLLGEDQDALVGEDMEILIKIALDSIPRKRRQAIIALAKYKLGITTSGIAMALNYPSDTIKITMYELNALGFCTRERDGGADKWRIAKEWEDIVVKFEEVDQLNEELNADGISGDYEEVSPEVQEALKQSFSF